MAGERYRHIFLPSLARSQGFTNPRHGGSSPLIPGRNPHRAQIVKSR